MSDGAQALADLAAKLGTTAERAWPIYVSYVKTEAWTSFAIIGGLWGVLAIVACVSPRMKLLDEERAFGLAMLVLILMCATVPVLGIYLPVLINPEGAAMARLAG